MGNRDQKSGSLYSVVQYNQPPPVITCSDGICWLTTHRLCRDADNRLPAAYNMRLPPTCSLFYPAVWSETSRRNILRNNVVPDVGDQIHVHGCSIDRAIIILEDIALSWLQSKRSLFLGMVLFLSCSNHSFVWQYMTEVSHFPTT